MTYYFKLSEILETLLIHHTSNMDSDDNDWLYVAPRPYIITILCSEQEA